MKKSSCSFNMVKLTVNEQRCLIGMLDVGMRINDNIDPNWETEVCKWSVTINTCSFPYIGKSNELDHKRKMSTWGDKWLKSVVVVLRSPIHANEPSECNGMLYRTSNRVLNNGIKVIILICMDGTSQYHHHPKITRHDIEPINMVNTIYCNNGNRYFAPLRHHRIINTWSSLTNEVSKYCDWIFSSCYFYMWTMIKGSQLNAFSP